MNGDGDIPHNWVADDPHTQPDFEAVEEAVEAAG